MMINKLAKKIHQNAIDKGFFDDERNIGEMLCLIHSEVSEALEADRKGRYSKEVDLEVITISWNDNRFMESFEGGIKDTFEDEMADIVIRVFDMCAFKNIDLEGHIKAKMRYNSLREYKHGKKY